MEIPKLLKNAINNISNSIFLIKAYTSQGFNQNKINFQNELIELQNFQSDSE